MLVGMTSIVTLGAYQELRASWALADTAAVGVGSIVVHDRLARRSLWPTSSSGRS
jgi:hypothetical protein